MTNNQITNNQPYNLLIIVPVLDRVDKLHPFCNFGGMKRWTGHVRGRNACI